MTVLNDSIQLALAGAKGVTVHNGSLRLQFKLPDKIRPVRKSLGYSPTEHNIRAAELTLQNIKRDVANALYKNDPDEFWRRHFPTNSINQGSAITVRQCYEEFKHANINSLSDSITDKLTSSLNWLKHYGLENRPIRELTKNVLNNIRQKTISGNKTEDFQGCRSGTVREYTNSLKLVLDYAFEQNYIKQNPVPLLLKVTEDDFEDEDLDVRPFSQLELDSLLSVIHVPQVKLMAKLLAWTGMRHGELKALAWEDINLKHRVIHVKYNLTRKGKLKPTKTRAGNRKIELLPAAVEVLKKQKEHSFKLPQRLEIINFRNQKTKTLNRRRVFLSRGNEPYKRPELTTAPKQWKKWLEEAGLEHRPAYQLRHTFASRLLMASAEPSWLAKQMGHKDWGMVRKVYAKWIQNEKPDYVKGLAQNLGQSY